MYCTVIIIDTHTQNYDAPEPLGPRRRDKFLILTCILEQLMESSRCAPSPQPCGCLLKIGRRAHQQSNNLIKNFLYCTTILFFSFKVQLSPNMEAFLVIIICSIWQNLNCEAKEKVIQRKRLLYPLPCT